MLNRHQEYEKMAAVERFHWWYQSLHSLVVKTIEGQTADRDIAIIDAGCGTGGLICRLRDHGYRNLKGLDLSADAIAICRKRGLTVVEGNLLNFTDRFETASADVIVSNDTLYFFDKEEQQQLLSQFRQVLKPGGLLILNVPALKIFSGIHDISVGIRHRFSLPEIRNLLQTAQFEVTSNIYWPFLLSPVIFIIRTIQRFKMRINPDITVQSDIDLPPPWLNKILGIITAWENQMLTQKPVGSSLFLSARLV